MCNCNAGIRYDIDEGLEYITMILTCVACGNVLDIITCECTPEYTQQLISLSRDGWGNDNAKRYPWAQ